MLIKLTNDIFYPSNKIAAKITIVMLAHAGEKVKTVTHLHLKKACGYDLKRTFIDYFCSIACEKFIRMSVLDKACLIIYRFAEKGLEIFLLNDPDDDNPVWAIPNSDIPKSSNQLTERDTHLIELDPIETEDGRTCRAVAIEGDWHDIPSMRTLVKQDVSYLKDKVKEVIPELEQGTFVAVKEAFKKVLPHEYAMLKELKEILTDRNLVKNL